MSKYNTEQRRQLMNLFEASPHKTLSAQDIITEIGEDNISVSAVYRNLSQMRKDGLLCRINAKSNVGATYQYINPEICKDVVHLKCQDCDTTIHLNKHVSQLIFAVANEEHGFKISGMGAYLYGKCDKCSQIYNTGD